MVKFIINWYLFLGSNIWCWKMLQMHQRKMNWDEMFINKTRKYMNWLWKFNSFDVSWLLLEARDRMNHVCKFNDKKKDGQEMFGVDMNINCVINFRISKSEDLKLKWNFMFDLSAETETFSPLNF